MSLTELELNQQLIEALAECDRLRAENARLAESACDGSIEQSHRDSTKAAIAALRETHPEITYESPAQVIGWLQAQLAEAQKNSARLDWLITHHESIGFTSGDREPDSWIETSKLLSAIDKAMVKKP